MKTIVKFLQSLIIPDPIPQRIAKESPRDGWTIMEVLYSFVRGKQKIERQDSTAQLPAIRTDAQAALTAISRRKIDLENEHQYLDLSFTNLCDANLVGANLDRVKLNNSNLTKADLHQANLNGANLTQTKLDRANLIQTDLRKTKNLNITQIKQAQNWTLAIYDPEIDRLLKAEPIIN